jgi:hypothetical protein
MARNRFPGQDCVLCSRPSEGVGEHVIPKWYIDEFAGEGPFESQLKGEPYKNRKGQVATLPDLPVPHVPMCSECNGLLNTHFENPAKPVVRKLLPGSASHVWPAITDAEARALGRWMLKIGILWAHPDADDDNPHVNRGPDIGKFNSIDPQWLAWMAAGSDPPDGFSVHAWRRDLYSALPWTGSVSRVELPAGTRDGQCEVRFMKREIGIKGLDAVVAWHPGWPLDNPLVTEGRAAVLWPHPEALDFAALGEVREGTCVFEIGQVVTTGQTGH